MNLPPLPQFIKPNHLIGAVLFLAMLEWVLNANLWNQAEVMPSPWKVVKPPVLYDTDRLLEDIAESGHWRGIDSNWTQQAEDKDIQEPQTIAGYTLAGVVRSGVGQAVLLISPKGEVLRAKEGAELAQGYSVSYVNSQKVEFKKRGSEDESVVLWMYPQRKD